MRLPIFEQSVELLTSLYFPCLPRVLTVDDDPVLSGLIKKVLSAEDMIVQELNEPIRILDTLEEFRPDIILLDVIMPRRSGPEVYAAIKSLNPNISVVFTTGYSNEISVLADLVERGVTVLRKPYSPAVVCRRIREVLDAASAVAHSPERID